LATPQQNYPNFLKPKHGTTNSLHIIKYFTKK